MTEAANGSQERFLKEIFIEDDSELIVNEEAAQSESKDDEFDIDSLDKVSQDPPKAPKKSRKSATPKKVVLSNDGQASPMSKKAQILAQKAQKEAQKAKASKYEEEKQEKEEKPEKEGEPSDDEATTRAGEGEGEADEKMGEPEPEKENAEEAPVASEKQKEKEASKEEAGKAKAAKAGAKLVKRRPGLVKKKAVAKPAEDAGSAGEQDEYASKTLAELKALCKERKLPVTGNKTVLLGHLRGTSAAATKAATPVKKKVVKKKKDEKEDVTMEEAAATPKKKKKAVKRKADGDSPEAPSMKKQRTPKKDGAKSPKAKSPSTKARSPKAKAKAKPAKVVANAIVTSGIDFGFKDVAASMCKTLGKYKYADTLDDTCKYLVVGSKESRTVKLFLAMVNGVTVVKFNWIMDSLEDSCWKDPLMYEATDWFPGCKMTREVLKNKSSLDLLQGVCCYIGNTFAPRDVLTELVMQLGGTVTPLRQATVCLSRTQIAAVKNQQGLPVVTERWLIDSLLAYKVADKKTYAPEEAIDEEDSDEEMEESPESPESEADDDDFDAAAAEASEEDDDEEMDDAE